MGTAQDQTCNLATRTCENVIPINQNTERASPFPFVVLCILYSAGSGKGKFQRIHRKERKWAGRKQNRSEDSICLYPEMMMCLLGIQGRRLNLHIPKPEVFCYWRGRSTAQNGKTKAAPAWKDGTCQDVKIPPHSGKRLSMDLRTQCAAMLANELFHHSASQGD